MPTATAGYSALSKQVGRRRSPRTSHGRASIASRRWCQHARTAPTTSWTDSTEYQLRASPGFGPETPVRCHVWHNLTPEQEAAIFEETNADRKSVKPLDLFRARIAKREPIAIAIDALLKAHGWEIGSHGKTGNFAAVKTLESIYNQKNGPETCRKTLWAITGAWDREPDSTHQTVVKVIGLFVRQYPDADLARLVQVLRREASMAAGRGGSATP